MGTTPIRSKWESGTLYFYEEAVGRSTTGDLFSISTSQITVGNSAQDVDFKVFLGSAAKYVLFDAGDGKITYAGAIQEGFGTNAAPLSYTAGTPIKTLYATNAGESGSVSAEPFYLKSVLTGAGQVGGRSRFHTYSNVASGGWVNALKAYMEFGASGSASGLASALCAETVLSAGTTGGTYCALEAELVLGSGASTGTNTSFIYCNASGAGVAAFDTNGLFIEIGTGITPAAGKFASLHSQTLKCKIEANTRYMVMSQLEDGLGLGSSGTAMTLTTYANHAIEIYTTCASDDGSNSVEPIYVKSTMTGAGGVGGRARFHMYTNVALGGWANALKAYAEFGASGRVTGLGSALCAELALSAGTTQGNYAAVECELIAGSGASTGTATGFFYCNADGTDEDTVDSNAFLFIFGDALDAASGKFIDTDKTTHNAYGGIRISIEGVGTKYLAVVDN